MTKIIYPLFLFLILSVSCDSLDDLTPENRSFYMGFQPWEHDLNRAAKIHAYDNISIYGDIISMQLDKGVPWEQAYTGAEYPSDVLNDINERKELTPLNAKIFLSLMPLSEPRNDIAQYWGKETEEIKQKWESKRFTDITVITAYLNHCRRMITLFDPDYLCYAVESNASFSVGDAIYQDFLIFCDTIYTTLKDEYPDLPIMLSVVTNFLGGQTITETTKQLIQYSDYMAISSYPFLLPNSPIGNANPQNIPHDWFSRMANLAPNKPICVTETAYIAEDLKMAAYFIDLKGRIEWQAEYVQQLFTEMNELNAEFIIWFTARDYNYAGKKLEGVVDPAYYIWIDTGILDEDGKERPSAKIWNQWKSIPKI